MLSYAFQTLRETGFDSVASEDFENIHDLFAAILIRGVGAQVKRGLHRDYIQNEEALAGLRGQIKIAETIKQQTMTQRKLVCSYDEFSPDSPHNQALKSVMLLLLRYGNVKPENKKALRKLLLYFVDVAEVSPATIQWGKPPRGFPVSVSVRTSLGRLTFFFCTPLPGQSTNFPPPQTVYSKRLSRCAIPVRLPVKIDL